MVIGQQSDRLLQQGARLAVLEQRHAHLLAEEFGARVDTNRELFGTRLSEYERVAARVRGHVAGIPRPVSPHEEVLALGHACQGDGHDFLGASSHENERVLTGDQSKLPGQHRYECRGRGERKFVGRGDSQPLVRLAIEGYHTIIKKRHRGSRHSYTQPV